MFNKMIFWVVYSQMTKKQAVDSHSLNFFLLILIFYEHKWTKENDDRSTICVFQKFFTTREIVFTFEIYSTRELIISK